MENEPKGSDSIAPVSRGTLDRLPCGHLDVHGDGDCVACHGIHPGLSPESAASVGSGMRAGSSAIY